MHRYQLYILLSFICIAVIPSFGQTGEVELKKWVNDYTNTLSASEQNIISEKLIRLEDSTQAQLVVAIVPTTKPQSIEYYTRNLANRTGIGRKNYDDGLLMLIAKDDRKVRLEVGRGLERIISDEVAQEIIDDFIVPYFKKGDFDTGINEGIEALKSRVQLGYLPTPPHARYYWVLWFFIPLLIIVEILKRFVKYRGWLLALSIISAFLIGWLAVNIIIGIALTCFFYLVTFMMLKFPKYRLTFKRAKAGTGSLNTVYNIGFIGAYVVRENIDTSSSGGWFSGGSSGSGFGGSSGGSGGGFSGGGGSFGGGGATGGW